MSIFDQLRGKSSSAESNAGNRQDPSRYSVREETGRLESNIRSDKMSYPEDADAIDDFHKMLKIKIRNWVDRGKDGSSVNAIAHFFMTEDRLRALACIFPPKNGGVHITMDDFEVQMRFEGITSGILTENMKRFVSRKEYFHVFPLARGERPQEGKEGSIRELFPHQEMAELEAAEDEPINFEAYDLARFIQAGEVICEIDPNRPGKNGVDVTGQALPCRKITPLPVPMGENTRIRKDGRALEAKVDGILYTDGDKFCVWSQRVIRGDLNTFQGVLRVKGGLYVTGDLDGGVMVEADGNVIVGGAIRSATVVSTGGCIRAQQGILGGNGRTVLKAARQVQSPQIESAEVDAAGNIFADAVVDSTLRSGGTVNVLGGQGLIVGGMVQAKKQVNCRRIGSVSGRKTSIFIGCSEQDVSDWERNKQETEETQKVIEKLWDNITKLRKVMHLTEEQREILEKLVEQRSLYEARRDALKTEKNDLRQQFKETDSGRIKCLELYPVLELHFGEHSLECTAPAADCDIHLNRRGEIVLR